MGRQIRPPARFNWRVRSQRALASPLHAKWRRLHKFGRLIGTAADYSRIMVNPETDPLPNPSVAAATERISVTAMCLQNERVCNQSYTHATCRTVLPRVPSHSVRRCAGPPGAVAPSVLVSRHRRALHFGVEHQSAPRTTSSKRAFHNRGWGHGVQYRANVYSTQITHLWTSAKLRSEQRFRPPQFRAPLIECPRWIRSLPSGFGE